MLTLATTCIIIVNYNGGSLLANCIDSVRKHTTNHHIILVDNDSRDKSLSLVEPGPDLQILKLPFNVGFARANNIGIRASSLRYVVLLNSDTVVTPQWLEKLIATADQSPDIGVVTPKLLRPGSPPIIDSTGHLYQYQTGLAVDRGSEDPDSGQYDRFTELPSCCFACALVKREVFERVGLLDEKMFLYFEDVDFGIRARIAGWRVVYCPESLVYHYRGGSTPKAHGRHREGTSRAYLLRILLKNYETKNMLLYGGKWFLMDILRVTAGLKNWDWNYCRTYATPILWNLANLPFKERVFTQRLRAVSDSSLFTQTGAPRSGG